MEILMILITVIYYALVGYTVLLLVYNLIKTKSWEKEILYVIVFIPFVLRLLRLK